MELMELIDRCLYEDEVRDILVTIGEEPEGQKQELIMKLVESKKDAGELIRMIDEDMLTMVCLESGVPTVLSKDQMVDCILEDVLGTIHDYTEITLEPVLACDKEQLVEDLPEVSFDKVLTSVGEWTPANVYLPRAVITKELGQFLETEGYPVTMSDVADIQVGMNVSIEMARGRIPKDIDGLLERMINDLAVHQYAIGVMYGVESESMVDQLEEALENVFEDPDRVAIVLI